MEGKKLQEILKIKGITQTQIAELLGITKQSVSAMMKAAAVKSSTLEKIAHGFNLDITEFFGGHETSELKREIEALRKKLAEVETQLKQKDETINRLIGILERR